jgi:TRAP-type mannitol/chloroaromatic compound transport system substrate-binding protein
MRRREFVSRTLPALVTGVGIAGCAQEQSGPAIVTQPRITWRLASSFPRSLDTIYGACDVVAARVSALSEGRFQIRPYSGGEIVPALQVMDAVQQRTVEVAQTASYYFTGKNPALAFDCTVPFGLTARQQSAWLLEAGGLDLMREVFADFNMINLPGGNTGVQMGGWFKREINSVTDLRGLKMRIPGMGGDVMDSLGVSVQVLPGSDIYPALERGAIDATEWIGPYDDEKLGFHKAARFYYYPGWWEPGPSLSYLVNRDAWDSLPKTYQEMLTVASHESAVDMMAKYDGRNPAALTRLVESGVQLRRFTDDVMTAAEAGARDVLETESSKNASCRKVYEHWKVFREQSYDWFERAELAYAEFAFRSKG